MLVNAFGIPGVPGSSRHQLGGNEVVIAQLSPSLDFKDVSLVIVPASAQLSPSSTDQSKATELLFNRVIKHSQDGNRVCVFYGENFTGGNWLGTRLLERWHIEVQNDASSLARVYARHFEPYMREYGYSGIVLKQEPGTPFRRFPIAGSDKDENSLSCFAVEEGRGLVYVAPANFVDGAQLNLLSALIHGIEAHSRAIRRPATAPIADSFVFTAEAESRAEHAAKLEELSTLEGRLAEYGAKKDILFLRDDPLAERVPVDSRVPGSGHSEA